MDLFKRTGLQPSTDGQRLRKADEAVRAGLACLEADNPRQAEAEFRKAVGLHPENAGLRGYLGLAIFRQGRLAEANKELQASTTLAPNNSMLRYTHGQILEGLLRQDDAADEYAAASSLSPDNAAYVAALASLELKRNNVVVAESLIRHALELNPNEPQALADCADLLQRRGDLAGAIACLQRSISVRPGNVDDRYRLGTFLEDAGHFDAALNNYKIAFDALQGDVEVVYALSRVLMKIGREADAIGVYAQVIKRDPDNRSIYEMDLHRLLAEYPSGTVPQSARGGAQDVPVPQLTSYNEIPHPGPVTPSLATPQEAPQPRVAREGARGPIPTLTGDGRQASIEPALRDQVQPTTAIAQLEAASAADPTNSRLHQELSILYLQGGQLAAAKEHGRLAEALRAQRPQARSIKSAPSKALQ